MFPRRINEAILTADTNVGITTSSGFIVNFSTKVSKKIRILRRLDFSAVASYAKL